MPHSHSPLSYNDCRGALDKALSSERGVKITCVCSHCKKPDCKGCVPDSKGAESAAIRLVHRLNSFRAMDRRTNKKLYPEGDPMHNASHYDSLVIKREVSVLLIEKVTEDSLKVEEL